MLDRMHLLFGRSEQQPLHCRLLARRATYARILGVGYSLSCADPASLQLLEAHLSWTESNDTPDSIALDLAWDDDYSGYVLSQRAEFLFGASDLAAVADFLNDWILSHAARTVTDHMILHAGVAGWDGRVAVLPGSSHSGKSTLVTSMVEAGATYFSDDRAVVNGDGAAIPLVTRLSIREHPRLAAGRYRVEDLGFPVATSEWDVGMILLAQHQPGARWRPRRLRPAEGLVALLPFVATPRGDHLLEAMQRLVEATPIYEGRRGEASEVVDWIRTQS